ncbi:MAG: ImmA/IrrE family metallo-endopeptidase [Bacteroidia bacterium]|nr:ImmA/IrrE family metallo-endopeptidase [Bacteroidia bacterium]
MMDLMMKKQVTSFRERHGISSNEPIRLKSLLMKLQVQAVFRPMSGIVSGMAIKAPWAEGQALRFMLINSQQSLGRQHFTICHELYHLFVQENFSSRRCVAGTFDKRADKEEYNADLFAALLLLPEEGMLEMIPAQELKKDRVSLATLLHIEQYFSCSRSALLQRLRELALASPGYMEAHRVDVRRGALSLGYPADLYLPGNHGLVISDYGPKAHALFEQDRISESHYLSLMYDIGVNLSDQPESIADAEKDLV